MLQRQPLCTTAWLTSVDSELWQLHCAATDVVQLSYRDGGSHSSLAQLLKDLEKRAEGGAAATEAVGSTISRPLHVVLQVSNATWNISFCRCCKILSARSLRVCYLLAHVRLVDHVISLLLHVVLHAITVFYYIPHD